MKPDLQQLREKYPLPLLMDGLGMRKFARSSCPSPFRLDRNASWGIFERNGRWYWKDFATGEAGDEISLLAKVKKLDAKRDFKKLLDEYAELAKSGTQLPQAPQQAQISSQKPDTSFLRLGSDEEITQLASLRKISIAGLRYAEERGVLRFGVWHDLKVFAVKDQSGQLAELRRLDGALFEGYGAMSAHKSHTIKFSCKNWPLGILEAADCAAIALVEGMPDFLALHQFVVEENLVGKVAPVAMLSSSCSINEEARSHFIAKRVRIFPHLDQPGLDAAERWQKELSTAAATVDFFNFRAIEIEPRSCIKDLCDFNQQRGEAGIQPQPILNNLV